MAVDDKKKRAAAMGILKPWQTYVKPDGTIDAGDRAAATWAYGGIASSAPEATILKKGLLLGVYNRG